jgi:Membrane fusion protein Use1
VQSLDAADGSGDESDDEDEENNGSSAGEQAPLTTPAMADASAGVDSESSAAGDVVSTLGSTLRSRRSGPSPTVGTAVTASASATATATAVPATVNVDRGVADREEILSSDRQEQEQIMESLLSLTRELKTSATTFHGSLEGEKNLLSNAVKGLDNNVTGLESAGKKMGTLRKMSEGKGWFGRIMLYAYIASLWVLALVIVFVLPKLRF